MAHGVADTFTFDTGTGRLGDGGAPFDRTLSDRKSRPTMFEKSKRRRGRSPERYPDVEPSGRSGAEGTVMSSWWVTLAGALLALAGAAFAAWGLFLLDGA